MAQTLSHSSASTINHQPSSRRPPKGGTPNAVTNTSQPHRGRRWLAWLPWLAVAYAATGVYAVRTNERAVVRRFGKALPRVRQPGLHMGLPWGLDRVSRIKVLESKRVAVGMTLAKQATGRRVDPRSAESLTGDRNLLLVSAIVQYRIKDPQAFLFHAADVPALVRDAAGAALSSAVTSMNVDDVLTQQRVAIQNQVQLTAQRVFDRYGIGVTVISVSLAGVEPPKEVADAFRDVTSARGDRERTINEANGYANRLAHQGEAGAYRIRREAEAKADGLRQQATAAAESFEQRLAQFKQNRQLAAAQMILETAEAVLPRLKKVLLGAGTREGLDLGIIEAQE